MNACRHAGVAATAATATTTTATATALLRNIHSTEQRSVGNYAVSRSCPPPFAAWVAKNAKKFRPQCFLVCGTFAADNS